jgi:Rad3-related DNA helicase
MLPHQGELRARRQDHCQQPPPAVHDARAALKASGFDGDGYPRILRLIIDEAHNNEDNARVFHQTYDPKEMRRQMGIIERRSGSSSLLESLAPYAEDQHLVDAIHDDIALLSTQVDTLDQLLLALFARTDYQPLLVKREYEEKLSGFKTAALDVAATSGRLAAKFNTLVEHNSAPDEFETRITELRSGNTVQVMGKCFPPSAISG